MNAQDKRSEFIQKLVDLEEAQVLELVRESLRANHNPMEILEDAQEGLRLVGVRYQEHEYYVSGLMMAGEIFREIMELVEPVLVQSLKGNASGHVLLGTIQGDIHDIGKNIFSTFLHCHGFTVTDIGVDVAPALFEQKAQEVRPDIIGISGLLTTSFDTMRAAVQLLRSSEDAEIARIPVIVGGGIMNAKVCGLIGADYWAIDAFVGTQLCKQIMQERSTRPQ